MKCVADKFQQNSSFIAQYENSSELPQSAAVDQSLHSLLFTSNDESFFDITPYSKGVLRIVQKKEFPYRSKKESDPVKPSANSLPSEAPLEAKTIHTENREHSAIRDIARIRYARVNRSFSPELRQNEL